MRAFQAVEAAQGAVLALLADYELQLTADDRQALAEEACRLTTALLHIRLERMAPAAVDFLPRRLFDEMLIDDDLARIFIREVVWSNPSSPSYDGLVFGLRDLLRRRWIAEAAPGGLWRRLSARRRLDVLEAEVGQRLDQLLAQSVWAPLAPSVFESVRSSLPLEAPVWAH